MLSRCLHVRHLNPSKFASIRGSQCRFLSSDTVNDDNNKDSGNQEGLDIVEQLNFAKAFSKFKTITEKPRDEPIKKDFGPPKSFATLLRESSFMQLGDIEGRVVIGKIYHIVKDDLYIDFGHKFHVVCQRPKRNGQ